MSGRSVILIELVVIAFLAATIVCVAATARGQDTEPPVEVEVDYEYAEDYAPSVPPSVGGAFACDSSGAAGQMKGGGVSLNVVTYPCEVARTFQTIEELQAKGGFWRATAIQFLRARLLTRGVFSVVFGLVGLG